VAKKALKTRTRCEGANGEIGVVIDEAHNLALPGPVFHIVLNNTQGVDPNVADAQGPAYHHSIP